jgi:hypothetical protein
MAGGRGARRSHCQNVRRGRVLYEALTTRADPLHLALVFGLSYTSPSRSLARSLSSRFPECRFVSYSCARRWGLRNGLVAPAVERGVSLPRLGRHGIWLSAGPA